MTLAEVTVVELVGSTQRANFFVLFFLDVILTVWS